MKRLLAISWEMPPMYGPRATQVSRTLGALTGCGWESTVICLDPRRGGPNWPDGADATMPPGVTAIRVKSPEEWLITRTLWRLMPRLRDRPDPKWVWVRRASRAAIDESANGTFAGLVSFAQPWSSHLAGLRVHRRTKLPWVAHFSDPWIDSPYWCGSAAQRAMAAKLEEHVVREATALAFVTSEAADLVMKKYPAEWRTKASVVPHGFATRPSRRSSEAATADRRSPLRLVYTGRFYDGLRTPSAIFRALAKVNNEEPLDGVVELTFVGPFVTGFAREARELGVDHLVRLKDKVAAAEAQSMAADADVLVVIDAPTDGPSPFLPSKLVDYLPLRKPILGITPREGASATLIRRTGGLVAAPDDEAGIRVALRDLIARWREGRLGLAADFDRVTAEYDITNTTAAFSDVLARAFAAPGLTS